MTSFEVRWTLAKLATASLITASVWSVGACTESDSHLDSDRRATTDLLATIGSWFAPMEIDEDLAELIHELERYSFTPSRVFQREKGWTSTSNTMRVLQISGRIKKDVYAIVSGSEKTGVVQPGDYRGEFSLEKLRLEHEYRWVGEDTVCLGDVPMVTFARIIESMFLAFERDDTLDMLESLPRTRATWGRLATLRVAGRREVPGGGTAVTVRLTLHSERIENEFPAFSRYLNKFVRPIEMDVSVRDESGALWMQMRFERLTAQMEMRIIDGELAPLSGKPRTMPEDLYLETNLSTKAGPFRVGFRKLETHLRFERTDERIALILLADREPEWRIPFLIKPFFTGALRRPFEGDGLESRMILFRETDACTRLKSDFRLEVKETWLLRRLGSRFGHEFDHDAELERRKFYEAAIVGLRDDLLKRLRGD